jgi:serine/threonine protein kinase
MSPQQAAGQSNLVDGRSDIFSLGVVFYELLSGRRPFRGETCEELLQQITAMDARPPRQVDDSIPRELECICLKALARHLSERYRTAKDFAKDLRAFLSASRTDQVSGTIVTLESDGKHCPVCHKDIGITAPLLAQFSLKVGIRPVCPHCDARLHYADTTLLEFIALMLLLLSFPSTCVLGVPCILLVNALSGFSPPASLPEKLAAVICWLTILVVHWMLICDCQIRYLRRHKRLFARKTLIG